MTIRSGTMLLELEVPGLCAQIYGPDDEYLTWSCFLHLANFPSEHRMLVSFHFPFIFIVSRAERPEGATAVIAFW